MRALLTLLMLSTRVSAEETPPAITFPVESQIVYVQVAVTDSRGRPVGDLVREDFTLYVDGKPAPLAAFRAPTTTTGPGVVAPRPPGASAPPIDPAAEEPNTFVAYIDNWNLTPPGRSRALIGLSAFLKEQLARGRARVLVVSAGHEAHVLSPLTTDAEQVAAALNTAEREPAHGHRTRSEERHAIDIVRAIMESSPESCSEILPALQAPLRVQAQSRSQELQRTLERLMAVVQALGTLPGPKSVFYLSEGLEQRPGIDLFHRLGDICPEALHANFSQVFAPMQEYDMSRAFQALAARANAARVTLYPIDGSGLQTFSVGDVSQANRKFVPSPKTDSIRLANLRAGQSILAEETGGAALFNANNPRGPLTEIAEQIRGEYVLGLSPEHAPEGDVHRVRVELRKKGRRLRYTPSYLHAARPETGAGRTLAALLVGLEEDTLGAQVSIDPWPVGAAPSSTGTAKVRLAVPRARLSAVEGYKGRHGRVRVVIAVWRTGALAKEQPLEVREELIDAPLPATAEPSAPEHHEIVIDVPLSAEHREIGVGVHDAFSRLATYRRLRVPSRPGESR